MSIPIGEVPQAGLGGVGVVPSYYYEPNDGDVGSTVSSYSTYGLASASVETESGAVPKTGETVVPYNMLEVLSVFGELT